MPRFVPFAGLRYSLDRVRLADVIAPPYDVVGPAEQAVLEERSPYNAIHVELARADGDPYAAAAQRFAAWIDEGVLVTDRPSLYAYEMRGTDEFGVVRTSRGVFGALAVAEGGVLPHEQTTPKAKTDRLDLLRATKINTSPIWVLTPTALSAAVADLGAPDAEATDDEGVEHRLWILDADRAELVTKLLAEEPVLVADGHHRYEVAKNYREEQRAEHGDGAAPYDLVLALAVELVEDQLAVGAIHRLLSGVDAATILAVLGRHFDLSPAGAVDATIGQRMLDAGSLAVVTADGTWLATPGAGTVSAARMDLDSSRLDVALAELPQATVVYQHGWRECSEAVAAGDAVAAVLLRPATVAQIAAVSHGGDRMPPKTTFFWPKPRTGMVFRPLT
ncbi:MAG TPA: DUF1015 domain-containing protein [Acidimicrobiales bacterium]|nr:DUF1015 domain-containing protein [Acidimicrobiales bacterium]